MLSQSDYINRKRIVSQIQNQNEFPPVLDSSLYTVSKSNSISSSITNSLITPSQLFQNLELNLSDDCGKFIVCMDTNNRPNRVIHSSLCSAIKKYEKQKKTVNCKCERNISKTIDP